LAETIDCILLDVTRWYDRLLRLSLFIQTPVSHLNDCFERAGFYKCQIELRQQIQQL